MMIKKNNRHNSAHEIRRHAQEQARDKMVLTTEKIKELSPEAIQVIIHELVVHQIEIEMQNAELQAIQEEMDLSRARYIDLYDLAPVAYCTLSEKGRILEANLTAATLLAADRNVLVKHPITRFIRKEDQDIYYFHRKLLFETGQPQACELRMTTADGKAFWARLEAAAAKGPDGQSQCRVMISDISGRKLSEAALLESEKRFSTLAESAPAGIYLCDCKGRCQYVNPRWCEMAGMRFEEALGDGWAKGLHPEDRDFVFSNWRRMVASGGNWGIEYRFQTPTGKVTWVHGLSAPQRDAQGKIVAFIGFNADITDRKQAELRLRQSEEKFRILFESSKDAGYISTREGIVVDANPSFLEMFGFQTEALPDLRIQELYVNPGDRLEFIKEVEKNGFAKDFLTALQDKNGRQMDCLITATVRRSVDGGIEGYQGIIRDVTENRQKQTEREHLIAELQGALETVRKLSGLLPICSYCKKIRDDSGYWNQIETYIREHSEAEFSHGICRECADKHFPGMHLYDD